jgi:hypothetical protein
MLVEVDRVRVFAPSFKPTAVHGGESRAIICYLAAIILGFNCSKELSLNPTLQIYHRLIHHQKFRNVGALNFDQSAFVCRQEYQRSSPVQHESFHFMYLVHRFLNWRASLVPSSVDPLRTAPRFLYLGARNRSLPSCINRRPYLIHQISIHILLPFHDSKAVLVGRSFWE